jgi:GH35 family endo-1,4-beta-xylanase
MSNSDSNPHVGGEEWRDMDRVTGHATDASSAGILTEARRNIHDLRTRDVELRLLDRAGDPVRDVAVEIEQTKHAFPFGDQLWALDAMARDGEWETGRAHAWRRRFSEVFNAANNLCYWTERDRNDASKTEDQQGDWQLESFARTVDWSLSQGLQAKGHPLFWSIPKCVPEWVKRYDHETRMKFAEVRVRNIVARFKGRVSVWDAVNEPMWEPAFRNLDQRQWPHIDPISAIADTVEPVLLWARDEDPDATYVVNDYGMENDAVGAVPTGSDGSTVTPASQRKRFLELLAELGRRGSLPDAIGLQSHSGWPTPANLWRVYAEFATTGLPIHITEFWASTGDLEREGRLPQDEIDAMQAEFICDTLTCAFGHRSVESFYFWGFVGDAIKFGERSGHEPKPVFERVRKLIREEWMTRKEVRTNADGVVRFRGFFGDYALRLAQAGGAHTGLRFCVDRSATMPLTLQTTSLP